MARRVAMRMVRSEPLAADLAQEAILAAYLSLDSLRDEGRFSSWLYGIVLNVCRNHIRAQKRTVWSWEAVAGGVRFETLRLPSLAPSPAEIVEQRKLHRTVLDAVNALAPKNREATLLFYHGQLSQREVATILGISLAAVKGRLHRARKELRGRLLRLEPGLDAGRTLGRRRKRMAEVIVADVVKKRVHDAEHSVVVLLDTTGRRILPIWIGPFEGQAMAIALLKHALPRPLTYDFAARLLEAAGAELVEVRVEALKGDTFYAVAKLRCETGVREVDARPSDALNLALRVGCPILVSADLLDLAAFDLPEEANEQELKRGGLAEYAKQLEPPITAPCKPPEDVEEWAERMNRELLALLFEGEV
jgi:RNA polymerase sigma factor (sigma-70 family)